jgi:ribonuclease J
MNNSLKITMLGGQEEIGLNSSVVEVDDDIVLVDLGNNFEDGEFGVNFYIPNIDLLLAKTSQIKGILITHGHYDHRAALPFLIDKLGYPPIYGSPFTIQLIKQQLKRFGKEKGARLIPLAPRQEVNLGKIHVKAIHLTHSIVGTYGYFLKTTKGNIFHTGDFKLDDTPFNERPSDYESLRQAGKEGVLVAMIDSTRANEEGHSQSETSIAQNLERLISQAPGRIIVSTFAQMLSRINQIALIGLKHHRQIFIKGTTLEKTTKIGREMGILDSRLRMKDADQMENFSDRQILLFATGSQGEERAALNRMLEVNRGIFKIRPTDTIILSSSSIPTNILAVQKLVDSFADRGCRVFTDKVIDIHAGGHGHQEEIKQMLELLKPRFVFPVEGYISFRHRLAQLAYSLGWRKGQVILAKNNQPVLISQQGFKKGGGKKKLSSVVIADQVITDGAEIVVQRKRLAKRGLLTVFINAKSGKTKITSWGVPSLVMGKIQKDLARKKIPRANFREIRKAIERFLRSRLDEDLVPAVRVESF